MKILYLTNLPSPYRMDFFNELGKECSLTVLFERKHAGDREKTWISEKVVNFKAIFLKGINVGTESAFCWEVISWLNREKYDIFVIGGYSTPTGMLAIQTLKVKNMPFFLNVDGGIIKNDNFLIKAIKQYFISSATNWLSTGQATNRYLMHYGAKENGIYTYPFTSVHSKEILEKPLSANEKLILKKQLSLKGEKIILTVGRFLELKGFDILIKSWKNISNEYTLLIIGSGPEEKNYKKLINELEIDNIEIIGFQNKENLNSYYKSADLFVFPTRGDVWGLVINEALANGIPIISTDKCIAAVELLAREECGKIIPVDDLKALETSINEIIENDELRSKLAYNSLRKSREYTIESMSRKHFEIFKKASK